MALFEVPGWSVPSVPVQEAPKARKRKRSANADNSDEKIQTAQINVEKLLEKFNKDVASTPGEESSKKKRRKKSGDKVAGSADREVGEKKQHSLGERELTRGAKRSRNKQKRAEEQKKNVDNQEMQNTATESMTGGAEGNAKKKRHRAKNAVTATSQVQNAIQPKQPSSVLEISREENGLSSEGLTALQAGMKGSLDGARFRYVLALKSLAI